MKILTRYLFQFLLLPAMIFYNCNQKGEIANKSEEVIAQEIEQMVWKFYDADTSRNAEKLSALMWPESEMIIDGHRIYFKDISEEIKAYMNNLVLFHTEWRDLKITPLGQHNAISSYFFKDSIINNTGKLIQQKGPNTFVWQRRNGVWKVLYVDADHYDITE